MAGIVDHRPRLSILESTRATVDGYAAIRDSIAVAVTADECGYHRLWVTEHHAQPEIASSAPAVLVAQIAARTTGLRVGSGGVMLVNHQPFVVAEQFATLEALHPGRIDLGIGGAPAGPTSSPAFEQAMGRSPGVGTEYPRRIDELIGFVAGTFPQGHPYRDLRVSPRVDAVPIFLLGSSLKGAGLAAERGLPFVFAHHLGLAPPASALAQYRASFQPSSVLPRQEPYAIVSVGVACVRPGAADNRVPYGSSTLVGSETAVVDALFELAASTGADELMVLPLEPEGPGRVRTVRLLAEAFHEARPRPAAPARERRHER